MSENKTEVKVDIMPAEDGSFKVVFFSAPKSPPLLGAKAVRVRLLSVADLHSPPNSSHSPSPRQASGANNAPSEDVTVAESSAEAPLDESILKKDLAAEEATAAETVDSDRAKAMFAAHKPSANALHARRSVSDARRWLALRASGGRRRLSESARKGQ